MNRAELIAQIQHKKNYLCVGLDTDISKIPTHLLSLPNPVLAFNKQIIDATAAHCVSYKINTAFYEAMGVKGWEILEETVNYIPGTHFKIADAKRGDIGNTSAQYAKTFFEIYGFDAVTVAPYMGEDSVRPFLDYADKWTIVLGLTSNTGSKDFEQLQLLSSGQQLYETVMHKVAGWGNPTNLMFVVGATKSEEMAFLRRQFPEHFFLVPGVGFQGGNLQEVSAAGLMANCGLLINASRAIIYAGEEENFAMEAKAIAEQYASEMAGHLTQSSK